MGKKLPLYAKGDYVVAVDQSFYIDAKRSKCIAKYVNHSCNPNCILQVIMVEETDESTNKKIGKQGCDREVWIRAIQDINKGEEITVHYGDEYLRFFHDGRCNCKKCSTQHGIKRKRKHD
jgi:Proteins containing SET domain